MNYETLDSYLEYKLKELSLRKTVIKVIKKNLTKEELKIKLMEKAERSRARKLWYSAKYRAKAKNIPFDIEPEDVVIPELCPYFKIPFSNIDGSGDKNKFSPSLDRIIPELGYVKGNIRVISWLANQMKTNASVEELILFAKGVLDIHS